MYQPDIAALKILDIPPPDIQHMTGGFKGSFNNPRTASATYIDFFNTSSFLKEQKRYAAFLSRRESISGESPISFPEDTSMPYSGFDPEPTRLQARVS
ncbi:hypothetical protein TNCV_2519841 [Trichonephila clavipes]|nr:hypothetical protein TNCV_2519841 [Trichonephila clavipes]